jgi:8-oxo-dGTP pyrophosphatase MutT (NUDIX family)
VSDDGGKPAVPAATVVLLRDSSDGVETLLARRNTTLAFAGGHWVFPGGRIDADDLADGGDQIDAARRACVREAQEEVGLAIDPAGLVGFAHWTAPPEAPRRFATWFFLSPVDEVRATTVDGGEILECVWLTPQAALRRHAAGELPLAPPTWIALWRLGQAADVRDALTQAVARGIEVFSTRMARVGDVLVALEPGDAGHETGDPQAPGPRHRLVMDDADGWRYERTLD